MKTISLKGSNHKPKGKHVFVLKLKRDKLVFLFFLSLVFIVYGIAIMAQIVPVSCFTGLYFTHMAAQSVKSKISLCSVDDFVMGKMCNVAHYHFSLRLD